MWLVVRRTKDLIKDQLPVKTDNIVLCPLTPLQLSVYKTFLASEDVQTMLTIRDPCLCGKTDDEGAPWPKGKCCHQGWVKVRWRRLSRKGTVLMEPLIADDLQEHHSCVSFGA